MKEATMFNATPHTPKRKSFWDQKRRDSLLAVVFILPAFYIIFKTFLFPMFQSALWSLYHYNLMDGSSVKYIGLSNYANLLQSRDFWVAMGNTIYFTILSVFAELVIGFACALLLNHYFRGRSVFRAMIIIPWSLLTLVNGLLWKWVYQPGYGALTVTLRALHLLGPTDNPVWLAKAEGVINLSIVADVWKMTPFMTLLILAGLQSVPSSLYEAIMIDGAGFWKKIRHITIPQVIPAILVAVVLRAIDAFRVYDILTVFTGDPTTSVSYLNFNYSFRYFYLGEASALAWMTTLIILILIGVYVRLLKRNTA